MSTTENNKLIAEFIGCKAIFKDKKEYQMVTHENMCYGANELQYHKDWNWLMEVVEKIESLDNNFIIEGNKGFINIPQRKQVEVRKETKIEAVYNACVEFIKWYNKQSK